VTDLAIPARPATLRTIRPTPCRSSRRPSAARNTGPSVRSPDGDVYRSGGAGSERDGYDLAALAGDSQCPVPALQAEVLDVGASGLRDPQPVQREHGDQRVPGRRAEPGGDEQGAELVAVQRGRVPGSPSSWTPGYSRLRSARSPCAGRLRARPPRRSGLTPRRCSGSPPPACPVRQAGPAGSRSAPRPAPCPPRHLTLLIGRVRIPPSETDGGQLFTRGHRACAEAAGPSQRRPGGVMAAGGSG